MRKISVKWFNFYFLGAPSMTGIAGSLLAVLDACLIDGFNVKPVSSFTITDGVGTITFPSAGHGFVKNQVIAAAGATNDAYNGDWRVTGAGSNSVTVDATGVANATVATSGGISVKIAPLGWVKPFSTTNTAAYKSSAADSNGILLRVDDTYGMYAKVRGYETMSDVNTGTGMFPTTTQRTETTWFKSQAASTAPRQWTLVGDDRFLYLITHPEMDSLTTYPNNRIGVAFGDFISYKTGDAYGTLLSASSTTSSAYAPYESYGNCLHIGSDLGDGYRCHVARSFSQVGGAIQTAFVAATRNSGLGTGIAYPNPGDNALLLDKLKLVVEPGTSAARGEMPGFWTFLNTKPLSHGNFVESAVPGRVLIAIGTANSSGGEAGTRWALDITGPWR